VTSEEIVRDEKYKITRFVALGLDEYEAIRAVEDGIDWRSVESLVEKGCPLALALEIAR
jgi:hypothetical protein